MPRAADRYLLRFREDSVGPDFRTHFAQRVKGGLIAAKAHVHAIVQRVGRRGIRQYNVWIEARFGPYLRQFVLTSSQTQKQGRCEEDDIFDWFHFVFF